MRVVKKKIDKLENKVLHTSVSGKRKVIDIYNMRVRYIDAGKIDDTFFTQPREITIDDYSIDIINRMTNINM